MITGGLSAEIEQKENMQSRGCTSGVSAMAALCYIYVTSCHINAKYVKIYVCHISVALEMVLYGTVSPEEPFQEPLT